MSADATVEALPPVALRVAVAALWQLPPGSRYHSSPEFVRLRETCASLYPNARPGPLRLELALENALDALGLPCRPPPTDPDLALNAAAAAAHLHAALERRTRRHLYLCPLDNADDLPECTFGANRITKFTAAGFEKLINVPRLRRVNPTWTVNADLFSEFTWLVIDAAAEPDPLFDLLSKPMNSDWAAIEPHRLRVPNAVKDALFAMLLVPWEDWIDNDPGFWRPFEAPWCYSVDDDLLAGRRQPPSADTLSGYYADPSEPNFVMPGRARLKRPVPSASVEIATEISRWLTDKRWNDLVTAQNSALFETPVKHFIVKAFLEQDPLDEFLAHITTIEAALGLETDYRQRGGATKRVAARVSALLGSTVHRQDYCRLFKTRSIFLHGRKMDAPIPGEARLMARRLARKVVHKLVEGALSQPGPESRDEYLDELRQ